MIKPLVSVVIPTFNRADVLSRAINSVLSQTYDNWEIIIIDNNSSDDTKLLMKSFDNHKIKFFTINNNGLISLSRNLGIKNSNGKYVAFLDSDDWWCSNKLKKSVNVLEKGVDVTYHDLFLVTKLSQFFFFRRVRSKKLPPPVFINLLEKGCVLPHSSVVIRKKVLKELGGLPEDVEIDNWGDYLGWLKISKITNKFKKIPGVYGYYWSGGGNFTTPERTIAAIGKFERILENENLICNNETLLGWLNYTKGRLFFKLKAYDKSRFYLGLIKLNFRSIIIYAKSRITLIVIKFFK